MSFLYPSALWFLALLAIPIFIHLFNLRRYEKVYFSNVDFLNTIKSSSRSKLTIKQWLALIFRLLAFAFLVITFAVPFLKGNLSVNENAERTLYIDNSFSNSNISSDGLTAFDNSAERILRYLDQFSPEDRFRIVTNNSKSRSPQTTDQITDLLSEISLSANRKELSGIINSERSALSGYYVFSDFQKNQFAPDDYLSDTLNSFYFFPAFYEMNRNVYVDSVFLNNPVLNEAIENELTIRLKNTGSEPVNDLPVFFTVNSIQVSSNSVDIGAESYTDLKIDINSLSDPINECEISFEDFPVTFDNKFYFSLSKTKEIKVLEVSEGEVSNYISEVYNTELFDYENQNVNNLNYSALNTVDFLILNQIRNFDSNFKNTLKNYVNDGGSLLFVPAEEFSDVAFLSMLSIGNIEVANDNSSEKEELARPSADNPFFSGIFEARDVRIDKVDARPVLSWRHGENILSYKNGLPYLTRFRNNNGALFVLNSALTKEASGFAESSLFLPVMYKLAFSGLDNQAVQLYYRTDAEAIVRDGSELSEDGVFKLRNGDQEVIPQQRRFNGQVVFDIAGIDITPGFWSVCDQEGNCYGTLGVNEIKSESELSQYSKEELEELASAYPNVYVLNPGAINMNGSDGLEDLGNKYLWKYSLLLVLLFFFAEVLILRFL